MNVYRLFVGTPEGKEPIGRPRRGRVDNIKTDPGEIEWGINWIYLAQVWISEELL
jgi:hypothetical protein